MRRDENRSADRRLSLISVAVGLLLLAGSAVGGSFVATLTTLIGAAFVLSGFVNLVLMSIGPNIPAFRVPNVIFGFVAGILALTFGMYGRGSGGPPADNPYRRKRAEARQAARQRRVMHQGQD